MNSLGDNTMKEVTGYVLSCALGLVVALLYSRCENKQVYLEYGTNIYHNTNVCDSISGFDRLFLDEYGEVVGSEEIDEKAVYGNEKYKMCDYCFSLMDIKHHNEYINNSKK